MDERTLDTIPFAVVDIETSGLSPRSGRIVEVAVVHVDGGSAELVFDSLVRPDRRIGNRDVHGITNRDVRKAPSLAEVAGSLCEHLVGRVVVAHNARFDMGFLGRELEEAGVRWPLPSLCTMELHRSLHGGKVDLASVCATLGITVTGALHRAADDARLAALVWVRHLEALAERGLAGLVDVAALAPQAVAHLGAAPLAVSDLAPLRGRALPSPRSSSSVKGAPPIAPCPISYAEALASALGDPETSDVARLRALAATLTRDEIAGHHALILGRWLTTEASGGMIGVGGRGRVRRAVELLARLGWAPGDE